MPLGPSGRTLPAARKRRTAGTSGASTASGSQQAIPHAQFIAPQLSSATRNELVAADGLSGGGGIWHGVGSINWRLAALGRQAIVRWAPTVSGKRPIHYAMTQPAVKILTASSDRRA
jgi:hypothetical protein